MESASPSHNSPNILQQAQPLPNPTPDNDEDNVHIAATALDDMRSRGPDQTIAPIGPATISPKSPDPPSRLPSVINTAIKVYDYSKANSRLVSYGAGIVESSVQAISKPVMDRLPNRVLNYARPDRASSALPLQDEQQMQVDNSERYSERESSSSDPAREEQRERALSWTHEQSEQMENMRRSDIGRNSALSGRTPIRGRINEDDNYDDEEPMEISSRDSWSRESQDYSLGTSSGSARFGTRPTSMTSARNSTSYDTPDPTLSPQPTQAVARRSGWHHLMVEAGGISAAVSDESMRRLKYCLEWLQWATANLDTQINLLEAFIASINATVTGEPVSPSTTVSPEALKSYMEVKRNVVNTIRQVVEVIGKYAGGSLPEPAKDKVKGFILSLPGRWSVAVKDAGLGDGWEDGDGGANANGDATATSSARSPPSSINPRKRNRLESSSQSIASESGISTNGVTAVGGLSAGSSSTNLASTSRVGSSSGAPTAPGVKRSQLLPPTAGAAKHAAHRVLTLAQESLHAVRGVTSVFKETLERAETWLDRLRRAGYSQSRRYLEDPEHNSPAGPPRLLPPSRKVIHRSPSTPISPLSSSPLDRRRTQTPRDLHLEALARSMPSVGPYGPYGTGNTPPMSPILGPTNTLGSDRKKSFPFDNPAPGAPGYGWIGSGRKNDSLAAIPSLSLGDTGRSRAGSMSMMSQYESSTGESLPPPSVMGSTSSVAGDDELDEDGEFDNRSVSVRVRNSDSVVDMDGDDDDGLERRAHKRRKKEDEAG